MSSKSSASDWVSDGNRLFAEGKHKDALKSYESALKADKKYKEALIGKGLVQQKLGKFKDAMKSFDEATKIDPRYREAWLNKSLLSKKLMKFDDAVKNCEKALEIDPEWEEAKTLMEEVSKLESTFTEFMHEAE